MVLGWVGPRSGGWCPCKRRRTSDAEGGRPSEAGGRAGVTRPQSSEAWARELGEREDPRPEAAGACSTP